GTAPCGSSYGTFQSLPSGWVVACLVTHSGFWIVELSQKITGELIRVSLGSLPILKNCFRTAEFAWSEYPLRPPMLGDIMVSTGCSLMLQGISIFIHL